MIDVKNRLIAMQCNEQIDSNSPSQLPLSEKRDAANSMIHINREPKRVRLGIDKNNIQNGQTKSNPWGDKVTRSLLERLHGKGHIRDVALLYSKENGIHIGQYWRVRQFSILKMNPSFCFVAYTPLISQDEQEFFSFFISHGRMRIAWKSSKSGTISVFSCQNFFWKMISRLVVFTITLFYLCTAGRDFYKILGIDK